MQYSKWKQISDEGYSADAISLLLFLKEGEELDEEHPKTKAILNLLERKQLIGEGGLTLLGEEILANLGEEKVIPKLKKTEFFEEWWKVYPATDSFVWEGRTFSGTQSKRVKKELCKQHFNKQVNEGILAQDIIEATKYHIEQAKKLSLKKGDSQLSYIANSERYIRERMYEPYIEMCKSNVKEPEFKSNVI